MGKNGTHIDWGSNWHILNFMAHDKHAEACRDLEDWSVLHGPSNLVSKESDDGTRRHFENMFDWADYKHSS